MAIYSFSHQPISRSSGRSSVAAAAYRSGEMLIDERTGLVHDYTRRRAEIESYIVAPEETAEELRHRESLWNSAEARDTRKNSRTAHEFRIALPVEFTEEQQRELIAAWVGEEITSRGAVADVAIHRDAGNPHVHVMATTRAAGAEGLGEKVREWDDRGQYERWRESWARVANRELERSGHHERIDHRSYKDQGIGRVPSVHEGHHVREMEARGIRTDRGNENRAVHRRNQDREHYLEKAKRDPLKARFEAARQRQQESRDRDIDRDR